MSACSYTPELKEDAVKKSLIEATPCLTCQPV